MSKVTRRAAELDFIGLPFSAPGHLECRLARTLYDQEGGVIDQGTRTGTMQRDVHRFVLLPGDDIEARLAEQWGTIELDGYEKPATRLMHHVAAHEWHESVLNARREQLSQACDPIIRISAYGFDLIGGGQLGVQLAKLSFRGRGRPVVTAKAHLTLLPGDDLWLFIEAANGFANSIGYQPLAAEDADLLHHLAAAVFTNATTAERHDQWQRWQEANARHCAEHGTAPLSLPHAVAFDFAERLAPLKEWKPVPVGMPAQFPLH